MALRLTMRPAAMVTAVVAAVLLAGGSAATSGPITGVWK
jgi:hypothetical protein